MIRHPQLPREEVLRARLREIRDELARLGRGDEVPAQLAMQSDPLSRRYVETRAELSRLCDD